MPLHRNKSQTTKSDSTHRNVMMKNIKYTHTQTNINFRPVHFYQMKSTVTFSTPVITGQLGFFRLPRRTLTRFLFFASSHVKFVFFLFISSHVSSVPSVFLAAHCSIMSTKLLEQIFLLVITMRVNSIYILLQIISATELELFLRCFCIHKTKSTKDRMRRPNEVIYSFEATLNN
jgi:hypothetical protein